MPHIKTVNSSSNDDAVESTSRDPRERFVELANKRVNRAIKDLRLIGNLSNRRVYRYSETDSRKIIRALQAEVDGLKARFRGDSDDDGSAFSL